MYNVINLFTSEEKVERIKDKICIMHSNDFVFCKKLSSNQAIDLIIVNDISITNISPYLFIKDIYSITNASIWLATNNIDEMTFLHSSKIGVKYVLPICKDLNILYQIIENYFANLNYENKIGSNKITYENLSLDLNSMTVQFFGESPVKLQQKQFDILQYLMLNPNRIITIEELWENCWKDELSIATKDSSLNTIHNQISRLRVALNLASNEKINASKIIQTVFGKGYKFCNHLL